VAVPARGHAMRSALIGTLLLCGGYYAGGALGMTLRLVPGGPSEIWLPQGMLLAAMLAAPVRRWWLYSVALLPTHAFLTAAFNPHVSMSMMFLQHAGQILQTVVAAALLRPILGSPPRLDSLRRMGSFIFTGAFLVPCVVQAGVVGLYLAAGFVHDFWPPWEQRVLARVSGAVIVAAPILHFANDWLDVRRRPRRVAELVFLTTCLIAAMPLLFAWKPGQAPPQWLIIVPLPFLLWSAVRFGPGALGLHLLLVVLAALLWTRAGRGPFATGSVGQVIIALQGFFLFISIPLMMLAALVSQHAQVEASLRDSRAVIKQSEEQVRNFVRHVPAAVAMFDRKMRYLIYSPRWLTDYKLGDQDLVGRSHYEVFPEIPERWKEIHRRCLAGEVAVHDDDSFVRLDGSTDWLRWDVRPWRNAHNQIGGVIMFTEVITERKRAEEEHRRLLAEARVAQALREVDRRKDEFLAMLSHELRNPLAPMTIAIEIMRQCGPVDDSMAWARDVVARQTAQLTRLVDDLLDVSRITLGKITLNQSTLDVRPIIAQAVEAAQPLLTERHHRLAIDLPADPLPIWGDGARLTQIVSNLLNNAARFTADGGSIALAARREGARVVVSVKDDGVGIPPDMRERVFDMFTQIVWPGQRKQEGLGIGLALVKRLVEMHDGEVEVRSAGVGCGTELIIRLPIAPDQGAVANDGVPRERDVAREPRSGRILVVDDNVDAAESLLRLLRQQAHEVRVAYDGLAAVAVAREMNPDVVLLDIGLPHLDGLEVARNLRARSDGPRPLLVAMTGFGQAEDRARTAAAGFDYHLTKPVDPKVLQTVMQSARMARAEARVSMTDPPETPPGSSG
jgi:PAS domain S-box-containing protein